MAVVTEVWRVIAEAPNYSVSNHGRVRRDTAGRRTAPGRLMTPVLMSIGYYSVGPTVDGKNRQFSKRQRRTR